MQNLHHDGAIGRILLLFILGRLGHQRIQTLGRDWHDDHKDDQQHQKNVDHRGHIDVRRVASPASNCH